MPWRVCQKPTFSRSQDGIACHPCPSNATFQIAQPLQYIRVSHQRCMQRHGAPWRRRHLGGWMCTERLDHHLPEHRRLTNGNSTGKARSNQAPAGVYPSRASGARSAEDAEASGMEARRDETRVARLDAQHDSPARASRGDAKIVSCHPVRQITPASRTEDKVADK